MPFTIPLDPSYFSFPAEVDFQLVDPAGREVHLEVIGSPGFVVGWERVQITDQGTSVTLPANDELPAPPGFTSQATQWLIRVHDSRGHRRYLTTFSKQNPPTNWNELIQAGGAIPPGTSAKVLPFYLADGTEIHLPLLDPAHLPFYLADGSLSPLPLITVSP